MKMKLLQFKSFSVNHDVIAYRKIVLDGMPVVNNVKYMGTVRIYNFQYILGCTFVVVNNIDG